MELSAFAHLSGRNIKVIQPGLVYVIQCDPALPKSDSGNMNVDEDDESDDDEGLSGKEKRKLRKERMRAAKDRLPADGGGDPDDEPTIYVA